MSDQVQSTYAMIRERILSNVYKPAQKLVETTLSQDLGVSRNTIRLALLHLERERLVEIEKNKGAVVRSFTLEEVLNYFEIRIYLERLIVLSAAEHITAAELKALKATLDKMQRCVDENDLDHYSDLNKEFHNIIYEASTNKQAVEFVVSIKTQLLRYHFRTILIPGRNDSSMAEHTAIYETLERGDKDAAEQAIQVHIGNVRNTIKEFYHYLI
ncbi:GntR family transcriptional regulator [Alicyclobacillus sp. SO9]|uniref:GntR family transcriptional regulator n=1 Tax=Alicyclobacillus sp. SO9 TaxID=2665646 RepID=UPI0018E76D50|nr:GntR family transcriptional regulator [Alicyclobacillus sp. SO9]QQE77615.1 GntR family transcriptional regulator [Alicyclobacillus sp. SO9]